jgi:diadenosine tetraphosphate (Ap4A) HIT family hydrolase
LNAQPELIPGQGYIVLNRHCEELDQLNSEELSALGPFIRDVIQVLSVVLHPARIHIGLYAETIRHIHFHVFPRMPEMPAGNIPVAFLISWHRLLIGMRLKRPVNVQNVRRCSNKLKFEFDRLISLASRLHQNHSE